MLLTEDNSALKVAKEITFRRLSVYKSYKKSVFVYFLTWVLTRTNHFCLKTPTVACYYHPSLPPLTSCSKQPRKYIPAWYCKAGVTLCNLSTFRCRKCFDERLTDKNLLHISLTKFYKLNKKRSLKINTTQNLISDFKNPFYKVFALYFFLFIFLSLATVQFFWLKVKTTCSELDVLDVPC